MSQKHYALLVAVTIMAGLIGGAVSNWVFTVRSAVAQEVQKHEKVITAEEFRLVDEAGNKLAVLGKFIDGSIGLYFADKEGKQRIGLYLESKEIPIFSIFDKKGSPRALITLSEDESPSLILANEEGNKSAVSLEMSGNETSSLSFFDKHGNTGVRLGIMPGGSKQLCLYSENEKTGAAFSVFPEFSTVAFFDRNGTSRCGLGVKNDSAGGIIRDEDGKVIWSAP